MKALGAYIFAGGFTVGVSRHFDVLAQLEGDGGYGAGTTRLNFPDLPIYYGPENWPIEALKELPTIDFIYGNPPCAAWSGNNPRSHDPDAWRVDPRVNCVYKHFSLLEDLRPKVWCWESVSEAPVKGRELVDELIQRAAALGYSATEFFHNAQWLGAPQTRKRWFLILHRVGITLQAPNFAPPDSALEVLSGIKPEGPPAYDSSGLKKFLEWLPQVPPGKRLRAFWEETICPPERQEVKADGNVRGRPGFGHIRLKTSGPASATVGYAMVHPTEHRFLSINEVAALAGFPPGYQFEGNEMGGKQLDLIARGVCPPVGEYLARQVKRSLELGQPVTEPTHTVVDYRDPPTSDPDTPPRRTPVTRARTSPPPAPPVRSPAGAVIGDVKPKAGIKVGEYIRTLIMMGRDTKNILELVHKHYPESKAGPSDVAWNRGRLRKDGHTPPTPIPAPALPSSAPAAEGAGQGVVVEPAAPVLADEAERPRSSALGEGATAVETPAPAAPHYSQEGLSRLVQATAPVQEEAPQPIRGKKLPTHVDPDRQFDTTSLRQGGSQERTVHRDYAAHFFRWGFAGRFVNNEVEVLDVGCGVDLAFIQVLNHPRSNVPKRYVGVDLNKRPKFVPSRQWAEIHFDFNFVERYSELGQFDLVTNFEVIEHMRKPDGERLLAALRECLKPRTGRLLLSTPVFNGHAAANHLHEWTIPELRTSIEAAGLEIIQRHGTFASEREVKKVATPEELAIVDKLKEYYAGEVIACFLAPLYPDASRNNVWVCRRID